MTRRSRFFSYFYLITALAAALLVSALVTAQASAQDPKPTPSDNEVNRVAKQMYCPVCENIPLDVCPTQACSDWRELIRLRLSEGWSDEQIKAYFAEQYGDRVLAEPPRRGLNWLVYLLPLAALVIGLGIVYQVLRSMRVRRLAETGSAVQPPAADGGVEQDAVSRAEPPAAAGTDPYIARMEEELRKKK